MLRRIRLGLGSLALVGSIASPAQQPEAAAGSRSGITGAPRRPPSEYKPSAAELGDALD